MQTITPIEPALIPMAIASYSPDTPLSEAFSSFIEAADVLERSYRDLQEEVSRLRLELQESNCDLARSVRENERMSAYLSGILESLPCGVIVLDESGIPSLRNREAGRLLSGNDESSLQMLSEAIRQRAGGDKDYELSGGDGPRTISARRAPLAYGQGSKRESVLIVRDVTEQRRADREREANRRMQALAEMSAVLAHEIRNPLTSVELFTSLLAGTLDAASDQFQWTEQIQSGLRLLSATVNNVLQFYSDAQVVLLPVEMSGLLKTTTGLLAPIANLHQVKVVFRPEVERADILGDAHKLQQVFFNLAVNAFRAMKSSGTLTIGLRHDLHSGLEVEFRDQGCGIDAQDLEKIFEPGVSRSGKGPGLGLAVCKRIVEQHAGSISVQSVPGKGSIFTIVIPVTGDIQ